MHQIQIIGDCYAKKSSESIISQKEMARAMELNNYYRVPANNLDLNYSKYFNEGKIDMYTSHDPHRINVKGIKPSLMTFDCIKNEIHD